MGNTGGELWGVWCGYQSRLHERRGGDRSSSIDLAQGDEGKIGRVFRLEIEATGDACCAGGRLIGAGTAPDTGTKLLRRFLLAFLRAIRYGQPDLTIAGRCAQGQEGIRLQAGGLLIGEVVKLYQQSRR